MNVPTARTRKDNQKTVTTNDGWTSAAITAAIHGIDVSKFAIEARKIAGGTYKGTGDKNVSGVKYILTVKQVAKRMIMSANFPRGVNAEEAIDNILKEFNQTEEIPVFVECINRLFFRFQVACCDGAALNTILRYEHLPDENHTFIEDGRRAFMQTWQIAIPVSVNASNNAKKDIENFFFSFNKDIHGQVDMFNTRVATYENARTGHLDSNERWAYITNAISGPDWESFRTVLGFQQHYINQDSFWLIDRIIEHVMANTNTAKTVSKLGGAASTSADSQPTDELADLKAQVASLTSLTAKLGAIVTANDVNPRSNKPRGQGPRGRGRNSRSQNPDKEKQLPPLPCRHCGKMHWDNECTENNKPTGAAKPPIKARAAAIASTNETGGFLLAARARPDESRDIPDDVAMIEADMKIISSLHIPTTPVHVDRDGMHKLDPEDYDSYFQFEYDHNADTDEDIFSKEEIPTDENDCDDDDEIMAESKLVADYSSDDGVRSPGVTPRDDHAGRHAATEIADKNINDNDVRSPGFTPRDDHVKTETTEKITIDHDAIPGKLGCIFGSAGDVNGAQPTRRFAAASLLATLAVLMYVMMSVIVQFTGGNISFQNNIRVQTVRSPGGNPRDDHGFAASLQIPPSSLDNDSTYVYTDREPDSDFPGPSFMVDSGASHNICHDFFAFDDLDITVRKEFEVVHGQNVTATGGGWVSVVGLTAQGVPRNLTFYAYYIPDQQMSLISVSDFQDKIPDCADPSFTQLSWSIQPDATFSLARKSGMFRLNACVELYATMDG